MALARENHQIETAGETPHIRFCGQTFMPLLSGALFWKSRNTLLVADLHFEKMSSFARSGQLLPPYDTGATLAQLASDIATTNAQSVICLGDSFHRDEGTSTLSKSDRARMAALVAERDWIWLSGNHDPSPHQLGGTCREEIEVENLTLAHHPPDQSIKGSGGRICGHLHPAARVRMTARSVRRPCFVHDKSLMILPAYGVSTGSLNILSSPFSHLFEHQDLQVVMIGRDRLYPVSSKRLVRR